MIKNSLIFLEHIVESINKIESYSNKITLAMFKKDDMRKSAITREIEIIGEAVKNLPIEFTVKYPHIEWTKIAGTRDKIVHNYFGVELDIIWKIVLKELPQLKKDVLPIIKSIKEKNK